jgi:alkylation response protein AidB-like acyl-CoA dehydrogenase
MLLRSGDWGYPDCDSCENGGSRLDFSLNEEQEMMQTMARDFLTAEYPDKVLRAMAADEKGFTPELWKKMAATNLTGLAIPEEYGGVGDFLDLIVVLEGMGRACFISPYFATVALAGVAFTEAGSPEQKKQYLTAIAEGKKLVTIAITEKSGTYSADAIQTTAKAQGSDYIINGNKLFVPDAQNADIIIVVTRTSDAIDGITLFIVTADASGVQIVPLKTIAGDKQAEIKFTDVKVSTHSVLGEVNKGWPVIEKVLQRASVARCAEMVGMAEQALKLTLDYAKERTAFGHPIGAFQAIQHRCADMLIDVDGSRFATYQAAWRINSGLQAAKETAIAKAWVGRACRRVMSSAHQVHGAIGFSQDHILHYYTKKAAANDFSFGDSDFHLEKLVS